MYNVPFCFSWFKKAPYIISPDINVNILEIVLILGVYCAIDAFGSLVNL